LNRGVTIRVDHDLGGDFQIADHLAQFIGRERGLQRLTE